MRRALLVATHRCGFELTGAVHSSQIDFDINLPIGKKYTIVVWFLPRSTAWLWTSMAVRAGYPIIFPFYKDTGSPATSKVGQMPFIPRSRYVKQHNRSALTTETVCGPWYREVLEGLQVLKTDQATTRIVCHQHNNVEDMLFGGIHILPE